MRATILCGDLKTRVYCLLLVAWERRFVSRERGIGVLLFDKESVCVFGPPDFPCQTDESRS